MGVRLVEIQKPTDRYRAPLRRGSDGVPIGRNRALCVSWLALASIVSWICAALLREVTRCYGSARRVVTACEW